MSFRFSDCVLDFGLSPALFAEKLCWCCMPLSTIARIVNSSSEDDVALSLIQSSIDQSAPYNLGKFAGFVFNNVFVRAWYLAFYINQDSSFNTVKFADLKSSKLAIFRACAFSNFEHKR